MKRSKKEIFVRCPECKDIFLSEGFLRHYSSCHKKNHISNTILKHQKGKSSSLSSTDDLLSTPSDDLCKKANMVASMLDRFAEEQILPRLSNVKESKDMEVFDNLKSIFLMGVWYGAYKGIQVYGKREAHRRRIKR